MPLPLIALLIVAGLVLMLRTTFVEVARKVFGRPNGRGGG